MWLSYNRFWKGEFPALLWLVEAMMTTSKFLADGTPSFIGQQLRWVWRTLRASDATCERTRVLFSRDYSRLAQMESLLAENIINRNLKVQSVKRGRKTSTLLQWAGVCNVISSIFLTFDGGKIKSVSSIKHNFMFGNRAIPLLFQRLFLISWENNRDCHKTMLLSLKTMEVQIKRDQWKKRFRTVQVYCEIRLQKLLLGDCNLCRSVITIED